MNTSDIIVKDTTETMHDCDQSVLFIPTSWILYTQFVLTSATFIVNTLVAVIFLYPTNRTPSSLLLSSLAITDCITSVMYSVSYFIGYEFFYNEFEEEEEFKYGGWIWNEKYSECEPLNILREISVGFHTMSVCTTVFLCIQKALAIQFPFWSRQYLRIKSSVIFLCVTALVIFVYTVWTTVVSRSMFYRGENGECCFSDLLDEKEIDMHNIAGHIFLLVSVATVIICTIYLCWKLLNYKKGISNTDRNNSRRLRSAIIVIFICIIFILSELIYILQTLNSTRLLPSYIKEIEAISDSFGHLSLVVGFALNFVVYIVMSEKLRTSFKTFLAKIFRREKEINTTQNTFELSIISRSRLSVNSDVH